MKKKTWYMWLNNQSPQILEREIFKNEWKKFRERNK